MKFILSLALGIFVHFSSQRAEAWTEDIHGVQIYHRFGMHHWVVQAERMARSDADSRWHLQNVTLANGNQRIVGSYGQWSDEKTTLILFTDSGDFRLHQGVLSRYDLNP
jgi:hypothetical protein